MNKYDEKMRKALELYSDGLISEIEYLNTVKYLTEERLSALKKSITYQFNQLKIGQRVDI